MNGRGIWMVRKPFQAGQCVFKCGFRNSHATILAVATQFDPFRFDLHPGPEPVDGPLPSVCLVDENDDLRQDRPVWLRAFAMIVITLFLGVSVLTAVRQVSTGLTKAQDFKP